MVKPFRGTFLSSKRTQALHPTLISAAVDQYAERFGDGDSADGSGFLIFATLAVAMNGNQECLLSEIYYYRGCQGGGGYSILLLVPSTMHILRRGERELRIWELWEDIGVDTWVDREGEQGG